MLRIGLLIDTLTGGGAERIVLNFAEGLSARGEDVHVILVMNLQIYQVKPGNFNIHWISEDGMLSKSRWLNKIRLARRLKKLVREIESDGKSFDFFTSNAEDMDRLSRMAGLQNVYIRYRNSMVKRIENKVGNKTGFKRRIRQVRWRRKFVNIYSGRNIVTVSKALQDEIVNQVGVKPKSITTIYNPFDFDTLRQRAGEAIHHLDFPDDPYIIYAAKFENRKRQDVLLKAFAQAHIKHKLVLIGDAYTDSDKQWRQDMFELINDLGITNRVVMPGFQQNPYPWIKRADLFAMSSDTEGLPTVLIESLIIGTRVVSTNCPTGPSEILTGKFAQFLSEPGEPEPLTSNIEKALQYYPEITDEYLRCFSMHYSLDRYLRCCTRH